MIQARMLRNAMSLFAPLAGAALGGCIAIDSLPIVWRVPGMAAASPAPKMSTSQPPVWFLHDLLVPTPGPAGSETSKPRVPIKIRLPDDGEPIGLPISLSDGGGSVGGSGFYAGVPHAPPPGNLETPVQPMANGLELELPDLLATSAGPATAWEVRAMYTEAVVRSVTDLGDYHLGLVSGAASASYDLLVPRGETPQTHVNLVLVARRTLDDPHLPRLDDRTRTLNPQSDASTYILGHNLLRTAQANGFPPLVADALDPGVSVMNVASADRVTWLEPVLEQARTVFAGLWAEPIEYLDRNGQTQGTRGSSRDIPLQNGASTRFFTWTLPFGAQKITLGTRLPLGRVVLDVRAVDSGGNAVAFATNVVLLQQGANPLALRAAATQGLTWGF